MIQGMIDPVNATNVAVQLTAEQISGMMQDRIMGLFISLGLTAIGGLCGAKIRNKVGKAIGLIIGGLGAIGTIGFTVSLINLTTQMV